jgi:hypothetical protein
MRLWHRDLTTSSRGAAAGHLARNGYKKAATASRSRGADASELIQLPTLESKRVQGKPGASRTRSLASNRKKDTSIHHRFSRITDLPCAMVLTVSFVLTSERPGFVVSVAGGYVSTGLAPASGAKPARLHRPWTCGTSSRPSPSIAFHPTFVTSRPPLLWMEQNRNIKLSRNSVKGEIVRFSATRTYLGALTKSLKRCSASIQPNTTAPADFKNVRSSSRRCAASS